MRKYRHAPRAREEIASPKARRSDARWLCVLERRAIKAGVLQMVYHRRELDVLSIIFGTFCTFRKSQGHCALLRNAEPRRPRADEQHHWGRPIRLKASTVYAGIFANGF